MQPACNACRAVKVDCTTILIMRADCGASGTLIKINPGLSSILTALHADCMQCMQAACRPVKMKLITPAFDWSFLVFLTLLPTSACFFSSLIWPLFTPWVTGGLYFLLHQNQLHPKIDKINGHLPHTKKLHVIISKLQVTETQKWCRIFYEKEEVLAIIIISRILEKFSLIQFFSSPEKQQSDTLPFFFMKLPTWCVNKYSKFKKYCNFKNLHPFTFEFGGRFFSLWEKIWAFSEHYLT